MKALTNQDIAWPQPRPVQKEIIYPESDGQPMADNTKQFRAITTIQGNLDILYKDDPLVLVVGDMFWYPVKGNNKIKRAPDVMVAFGVVKGDRGAYLQWEENNVVPQVVFEIRSPSNTNQEMREKRIFYEDYGVEEYYMYDPDRGILEGWQRQEQRLVAVSQMKGWVSPRLGIAFNLEETELRLSHPDGRPFLTFLELNEQWQQAEQRAQAETLARFAVEFQLDQVEQRADQAEQNLQAEAKARTEAEARLREAEAKLRELGLL